MEPTPDECLRYVIAAATTENAAIEFDRAGNVNAALHKYKECALGFVDAVESALTLHPADHPKLVQHREQVNDRIRYLESLNGAVPTIPVEEHIKAIQLTMTAPPPRQAQVGPDSGATLAACVAIGAAGAALILGRKVPGGVVTSAIGGAAAAGYCATRQDSIGDAVRQVGVTAVNGAEKVRQLNEQHQISQKIGEIGSNAVTKAKDVNEQYGITDTVSKGVSTASSTARDVNDRHRVSETVSTGISTGIGRASTLLGNLGGSADASERTWRDAAGRPEGNEDYQFGDFSRSLWHKARALVPSAGPTPVSTGAEAISPSPSTCAAK